MNCGNKGHYRKLIKDDLISLSPKIIENYSRQLSVLLFDFIKKQSLHEKKIGIFLPMDSEPQWFNAIESSVELSLYSPMILSDYEMEFRKISLKEIKAKRLTWKSELKGEREESLDVVFIPGLGFTMAGVRLGRGKGFYDRFLSKNKNILKVGLCFSSQLYEELPNEKHDEKMNYIITEQNILKCKGDI